MDCVLETLYLSEADTTGGRDLMGWPDADVKTYREFIGTRVVPKNSNIVFTVITTKKDYSYVFFVSKYLKIQS